MREGLLDLYIRYGVKKFSFADYESFSDDLIDKYVKRGYLYMHETADDYSERDDYFFFHLTPKGLEYLKNA